MLSAVMRDSSPKNSTTFYSKPVVGCPMKFWLINGFLLGMAVLYASFVAPCKEDHSLSLDRHIEGAMEVERVVASRNSVDYGLFGAGQAGENASTPEAGKSDPPAGTGVAEGTSAPVAKTPDGTQSGNAADTTEKPTYLIYFTATWCGPCQLQKPIIQEIKDAGKYKVYIVDIDNDPNTAAAWGVTFVPNVATVVDGKTTYRGQGAGHTRAFLESKLEGK